MVSQREELAGALTTCHRWSTYAHLNAGAVGAALHLLAELKAVHGDPPCGLSISSLATKKHDATIDLCPLEGWASPFAVKARCAGGFIDCAVTVVIDAITTLTFTVLINEVVTIIIDAIAPLCAAMFIAPSITIIIEAITAFWFARERDRVAAHPSLRVAAPDPILLAAAAPDDTGETELRVGLINRSITVIVEAITALRCGGGSALVAAQHSAFTALLSLAGACTHANEAAETITEALFIDSPIAVIIGPVAELILSLTWLTGTDEIARSTSAAENSRSSADPLTDQTRRSSRSLIDKTITVLVDPVAMLRYRRKRRETARRTGRRVTAEHAKTTAAGERGLT